jgi:hypothetical protein
MRPDHDLNEYRWDPASFKDVEAEVVNRLGNDLADASSQAPAHVRWPTDEEIASFRASSQDTAKIRKFLEIIRSRIQAQVLPPDLEKRSVLLSENSPWGECLFARWTAPYSMAEGPAGEWPCIVQVSAGQKDLRIVCGLGGVLRFRPLYLRFPETPLRERNAGRLMAGIFREADKHSWIPFTLKAREVVMEGSPKSFETITVAGPGYPSRKETRPLVVGLFHTKPVSDFWWAHINFWTDGVTYYFGCPA